MRSPKFFLFLYDIYYPEGGWTDCKAWSDNLRELVDKAPILENQEGQLYDCYQIVSSVDHRIVKAGSPSDLYDDYLEQNVDQDTWLNERRGRKWK